MYTKRVDISDLYEVILNNQEFICKKYSYSKEISRDSVIKDLFERLRHEDSKAIGLGLFDESGKIRGGIVIHPSEWDTQHFGIEVGKVSPLIFDGLVRLEDRLKFLEEICEELSGEFDLVFLRHTLSDYRTITALPKVGWMLTDVLLTFHRNVRGLNSQGIEGDRLIKVREAQRKDENKIENLARVSFRMSHFHSDPNIPYELSDELYAKWIISILNDPSSKVFVAEDGDDVCGFITCSIRSLIDGTSYGIIDLIAVDRDKRGRGISKLLLSKALEWFSSHVSSVFVGTQASNIPAVRLYEGMGFKLVESEATFHLWVK